MMSEQPLLFYCRDDGVFPNSRYPAILYPGALRLPRLFACHYIRLLFGRHHWSNAWTDGVFTYHHYHSTTHEALGFCRGATLMLLGGEDGHRVNVERGDVLIIPAGVAHKNLGKEGQVSCVGAYPDGRYYDIKLGQPGERPIADRNIAAVPMPDEDPVFGPDEGLPNLWELGAGRGKDADSVYRR